MHYEDEPNMEELNLLLMSLVRDGHSEMSVDDKGEFIFFMTDEQVRKFEDGFGEDFHVNL